MSISKVIAVVLALVAAIPDHNMNPVVETLCNLSVIYGVVTLWTVND